MHPFLSVDDLVTETNPSTTFEHTPKASGHKNEGATFIIGSMSRYFTLQQANEALEIIRPLMDEVQATRQKIISRQPEAWPAIEKSVGNGGNRALSSMVQEFEKLDRLVHQILDTGVQIKDVNIGLLDFSALKDGREVYLCWQYGEGDIAFWHEVDAGFAGRQPIDTF